MPPSFVLSVMGSFLLALVLISSGGALALVLSRRPAASSACAVSGIIAGALVGELCAFRGLLGGEERAWSMPWNVPYGQIHMAIDPLSAFFLVPIFALSALTAIYGRGYLAERAEARPFGFTWFAFSVLVASMAVVVVARQAILFLFAWEIMSLSSFALVTLEHEEAEVRRAGWVYLIATHVGTAFLVAMFLLASRRAHGLDFEAIGGQSNLAAALLLLLSLVGFGVKAGFLPFHVWLPEAHAAAPSHVSALMSGVLIKVGLYGFLRMLLLFGRPSPWVGSLLMTLGLGGALLGISLALSQRDMKRVLAYSSIENMGLIALGLGVGIWGWGAGIPNVAVLGMTGALLHVWNHTLMKGLMFLGAGSVLHGCRTKDLEQLGGIMKRMPLTGAAMVLGAVAIAGLPPLNGFVSEWIIYLGLIHASLESTGATAVIGLLAVGLVALVGGLAMLCFVRLIGVAWLGQPRSERAEHAHESPASMTGPLVVLAAAAAAAGLAPSVLAALAGRVAAQFIGPDIVPMDIPLQEMGLLNAVLWALLLIGAALWRMLNRRRPQAEDATWGCGYAKPTPRMQYTARSFAELMSERILPKRLGPRISVAVPATLFPKSGNVSSDAGDPLTRGIYEPLLARIGDRFARLRWLQQGVLHAYLLYILVATLLALAWTSVLGWSGR